MADEQTDEQQAASLARLIELKRAAVEARRAATAAPYTPESWEPWGRAAAASAEAITEHATTYGINRYQLEAQVSKAVLHPESAEGS